MNNSVFVIRGLIALVLLAVVVPAATFAEDSAEANATACRNEMRRRRAGNPECVARYARCGYGSHYAGYYVGGGAACSGGRTCLSGEPRYVDEGTFGMDYAPCYSRVGLSWYHGKKYQGGEGQLEQNRVNNGFPNFFRR